mmetsp:Transcript_58494/g.117452  ORF Transcript_58494/g.117452 Transcript_58494/m.117452 type:complete len:297 (-) Transcript_58494:505-1395(-)
MGQCRSKKVDLNRKGLRFNLSPARTEELHRFMTAMNFSWTDIDRFHACFNVLDRGDDGHLILDEFLIAVGADSTDFALEIFRLFDEDSSNKIDFFEFVTSCTRICCSDQRALARFAFRIIDSDNSGSLDREEVQKVFGGIYGHLVNEHDMAGVGWRHNIKTNPQQSSVDAVLDAIDHNGDGHLSVNEFVTNSQRFPRAIEPAFWLQLRLKKKVIGKAFWDSRAADLRSRFDHILESFPTSEPGDWWGPFAKFGRSEEAKMKGKKGRAMTRAGSNHFRISPDSRLYKRGDSRSEEVP